MTFTPPIPTPPESRDWTVVLTDGCLECGFEPFDPREAAARLYAVNSFWPTALSGPDVHDRPRPEVWSPVEYAAHARDMVHLLGVRVTAMLDADDPVFEDWDGDAKAIELEYWKADPQDIVDDMALQTHAAAAVLTRVDDLGDDGWARTGRRSDGVQFTVDSLVQYLVHDAEHHLNDVIGRK